MGTFLSVVAHAIKARAPHAHTASQHGLPPGSGPGSTPVIVRPQRPGQGVAFMWPAFTIDRVGEIRRPGAPDAAPEDAELGARHYQVEYGCATRLAL